MFDSKPLPRLLHVQQLQAVTKLQSRGHQAQEEGIQVASQDLRSAVGREVLLVACLRVQGVAGASSSAGSQAPTPLLSCLGDASLLDRRAPSG